MPDKQSTVLQTAEHARAGRIQIKTVKKLTANSPQAAAL
jgi:hypothetical protein